MHRDFDIRDGIYLCQPPHELDLHNNFDFCGLHYSIGERFLSLHWRRSNGGWVPAGTPHPPWTSSLERSVSFGSSLATRSFLSPKTIASVLLAIGQMSRGQTESS